MNNLRYSLPLEIKAIGQAGLLEGYASTFGGPPDYHGDIVAAGAFTQSLKEHKRLGTSPAMYWAHDPFETIGKWTTLREDDHGLFVKGKLTLTVRRARDAYDLAKDGAMALSIGFDPIRKSREGGANVLEEVKLGEVSLVGLAANPRAQITTVKSMAQIFSIREYEHLLRELGLSNKEAKRLSMGGWKAYRGDGADLSDLVDSIELSAQRFRTGV